MIDGSARGPDLRRSPHAVSPTLTQSGLPRARGRTRLRWWLPWPLLLSCLLGVGVASPLPGCRNAASPEVEVLSDPPPMPEDSWCVVSDEPSKPGFAVRYKGRIYYLCCKKCIRAFKANPEKYASDHQSE